MSETATAPVRAVPSWRRWTFACAAGETIGMAAAALAAGVAFAIVGEPTDLPTAFVVLSLAVAGGAVEGLAIGLFQYGVLKPWLPDLRRRAWVGATLAVAVAGWFLGMLPSTLASLLGPASTESAGGTSGPPAWLMIAIGLGSGLLAGAFFGAAQLLALRGVVRRPRIWVLANALGWAAAMTVIFVGASLPPAGWPIGALLGLGAVTGVLAGLAIGGITGLFLGALVETAPRGSTRLNRTVLALMRSPARRVLPRMLADLRYTGAKSGRRYALPVQFAREGERVVVLPGRPATKTWWRNLREPAPVEIGFDGAIHRGEGQLVTPADVGYPSAAALYGTRFPRTDLHGAALVAITMSTSGGT